MQGSVEINKVLDKEISKASRQFVCFAYVDGVKLKGSILKAKYRQSSNSGNAICLGSLCSSYLEMDYSGNERDLEGKPIILYFCVKPHVNDDPEYEYHSKYGPLRIIKAEKQGNTTSLLAYDDLSVVNDKSGQNFSNTTNFHSYILGRYHLYVEGEYVDPVLKQMVGKVQLFNTSSMQDKELFTYIIQMYGCFLRISSVFSLVGEKNTTYEFDWYKEPPYKYKLDRNRVLDFKKTGAVYAIDKLECIVEKEVNGESVKEKLKAGLGTKGISFNNPFMTQALINKIFEVVGGLTYQPATVKILGDPRLEVGDIIYASDDDGKECKIPIMDLEMEYDGGITTTITSYGGSDEISTSSGPTAQAIEKVYVKMYEADQVLADKVRAAEGEIKKLSGDYLDFKEGEFETLKSDTAEFKNTTAESLKAINADVETINGKQAIFEDTTTKNFSAVTARIETVSGDFAGFKTGEFETLKSDTANFKVTITESLNATNAQLGTVIGDLANFKSGEFEKLKADQAEFEESTVKKFTAVSAQIETVTGDFASFKTGEFETLKSKQANFEEATAQKFTAVTGQVDSINGQFADYKVIVNEEFTSIHSTIKILDVESQRVKELLAGNITSDNIATGAITAGSGIIAQGAIGDAEISSLSANKIKSGTVDTSLVTIASKDSAITITGNQLMVNDSTNAASPINRVILGKYTNGNATTYGLLIRGKDGKTVMLDGDGVHNAGITNGSIDNNKLADDANISGNKLDINSVVRSVNGATEKIQSTVVQVGDRSLNVYLGEQTNTITEHGESLRTQAASIKAAQDSIKLKLDTQTWTTAKEEIDGKISKNTSNLSKATSDITVLQGQITSKVEQADINKAVESIAIGGRNLFLKTSKLAGCIHDFTINGLYQTASNSHEMRVYGVITTRESYTVSFLGKSSETCNVVCDICDSGMTNFNFTTEYKKFYFTAIPERYYDNPSYQFVDFEKQKSNVEIFIKDLKIEKGNKATDRTPAPEDVDSQIAEVITNTTESIKTAKSEIKQTTDAITQNVSNLQTTVSTHTTQIGNKAETSAVTAISNRTASLETKLTGISGKVTDYVSTTVTDSTKDLVTGLETVNGSIEAINSKQANFELTLSGFATDVSNLEKTVDKKADGSALSTLSSTVSNLSSNLDGFKTSVSSTYTTKTELSNTLGSYSTTKQMNSAIEASKTAITSSVSETYSTKAELTTATGKITALETWKQEASQKITKDGIVATVGSYYAKDTDLTAAENRITSVESKATQTADKFNWIVKSGTSATDFTITDRLISLATARIDLSATNLVNIISGGSAKIQAKNITLDGVVTANSNFKILADGSMEAINGKFIGNIDATNLIAKDKYSIYPANYANEPIDIITTSISLGDNGVTKTLRIGVGVDNSAGLTSQKGISFTQYRSYRTGLKSYDAFMNGDDICAEFSRSDLRFGYGKISIEEVVEDGVSLENKYAPKSHIHTPTDINDYATCTTAANTVSKLVNISGFTLAAGARITVKFTYGVNVNDATLNVSGTGAKNIYYKNRTLKDGAIASNTTVELVYTGSYWDVIGELNNSGMAQAFFGSYNLNSYTIPGKYIIHNNGEAWTNAPTSWLSSWVEILTNGDVITQIMTEYNGRFIFVRGSYRGSWSAWKTYASNGS